MFLFDIVTHISCLSKRHTRVQPQTIKARLCIAHLWKMSFPQTTVVYLMIALYSFPPLSTVVHLYCLRGPGVIGEEPVLEPGRSFSYTSACPLNTNHGSMEGRYNMISLSENNDSFDVSIGEFKLDATASP